ncbi:MAG TPA: ABC transporter ATP-binding protein, partial [Acidimicrobiia bacterium]|nr:ABC transporter ATP-binding protein [Acidimicrobiia bacterium]
PEGAADIPEPFRVEPDGEGRVEVQIAEPTSALHRLTEWAVRRGIELERLVVSRPSLEDVYLSITEESTSD